MLSKERQTFSPASNNSNGENDNGRDGNMQVIENSVLPLWRKENSEVNANTSQQQKSIQALMNHLPYAVNYNHQSLNSTMNNNMNTATSFSGSGELANGQIRNSATVTDRTATEEKINKKKEGSISPSREMNIGGSGEVIGSGMTSVRLGSGAVTSGVQQQQLYCNMQGIPFTNLNHHVANQLRSNASQFNVNGLPVPSVSNNLPGNLDDFQQLYRSSQVHIQNQLQNAEKFSQFPGHSFLRNNSVNPTATGTEASDEDVDEEEEGDEPAGLQYAYGEQFRQV